MRHWIVSLVTILMSVVALGPLATAQELAEMDDPILDLPTTSFEGQVTVTGSLIPREDLTALSPVTIMEIPIELTYSGTVRIEDLIRTMPQVFAAQNSTISNGASGTASIDLRNLGPRRTLVLINGRRMATGDFFGADLNALPAPLVKRVDVLTGGASTVYGSDALAGVVNFVMDTDFTGVRGGLQYSFYNHDNSNDLAQQLNGAADFPYPSGMANDGDAINANVAMGGAFADGKGHAVAYLDYRTIDALTKASRDYLNCSVQAGEDGPYCGGSSTTTQGRFLALNRNGTFNGDYILHSIEEGGDGHSFRTWDEDYFNYGPYDYVQRPDEKFNAGAFANYEINRHFDVYMELMYMNNSSVAQIAPSGAFASYNRVNCDNPMLSTQQHDILCAQGGYADDEYANVLILRRNDEDAPRFEDLGHTDVRLVAGLRGEINDAWGYDFYGLRATSDNQKSYQNDLSIVRIGNALDVIEDPVTGEWVCRSGGDDGCVPWNIFTEGAVTQEAVDYMTTVAVRYQRNRTEVVNLTFTGDLEDYGVVIPSASEGLQLAVGAEYRSRWLKLMPDEVYVEGDAAGLGGIPQFQFTGGFNVKELFLELLLPIVQDVRGAQDLSVELGYRYSDYSTSGNYDTFKAMASWGISQSWRLRGGYNRAIREPSMLELYNPAVEAVTPYGDPCAGEDPAETFERCARTGVTAAQYGNIYARPFGLPTSYALYGGNVNLGPETGDTTTAGVVWTPARIRGLSITLDYYKIEIGDAIGTVSAETIHQVCMDTADPYFCGLIHRDEFGGITLPGGYTDLTLQNIGSQTAEGVDVNANYLIGLGNAGFLATDLMGTYMLSNSLSNPEFDFECAGYFGDQCGQPKSLWRHRFRATWETNFRFNLSLGWRYIGSAENDDASSNLYLGDPDKMELWQINGSDGIRPYNWFDLAASYTFRSGVKLTLGVNNILDEEPPLLPTYADLFTINLYSNYDPLGRYIFSSVQFNF